MDIKQKIIILITVSVSVLLATYFFLLRPTIDAIVKKKVEISNLKIEIINNREKEMNMDILTNKLKTIEPQVEILDSVVVSDSSGLDFIVTMENIAKKNNIKQTLDLKSPIEEAGSANYKKTPLSIIASGELDDIYKYLDDLESMSYYFNIEEFNISSTNEEATGKNKTDLKLVGLSYWKKQYENK